MKNARFIGEIGLDYTTKDINDRRAQEVVFKHIIDKIYRKFTEFTENYRKIYRKEKILFEFKQKI